MNNKILLVDDDRSALYALSEVLADVPARLVLAHSGEEALRQVLKQPFPFAAILLDVRLPNMDGFEVAAAIRSLERLRHTPIIFMSAHEDRRRRPRANGYEELYWRKPLVPQIVRSTVMRLLRSDIGTIELPQAGLENRAV